MKVQTRILAAISLAVLMCGYASAQDSLGPRPKQALTIADYQPATLREIAAQELKVDQANKHERIIVHGDLRPARVRATYRGLVRSLPKAKREVLNLWTRLYAGAPEHYKRPYQTEVLFNENGIGYWLVFKTDELARFKQEVTRGTTVDLFLIRFGATRAGKRSEPLLLVENYQLVQ